MLSPLTSCLFPSSLVLLAQLPATHVRSASGLGLCHPCAHPLLTSRVPQAVVQSLAHQTFSPACPQHSSGGCPGSLSCGFLTSSLYPNPPHLQALFPASHSPDSVSFHWLLGPCSTRQHPIPSFSSLSFSKGIPPFPPGPPDPQSPSLPPHPHPAALPATLQSNRSWTGGHLGLFRPWCLQMGPKLEERRGC